MFLEDISRPGSNPSRHCRYLATPWLSSPHIQTVLLNAVVKTPKFIYKRELFRTSDGGTIALDWLMNSDVVETSFQVKGTSTAADIPLLILIPGLTSDQNSPYIKEIAYKMAKHGWNVVVSNHRGLGGVPLTSECFYTAGKSDDLGEVVNYLHRKQPETPLYALGTSLGANILTIDAFHRWASSARLVTNVSVPLFCLNAIDDPVCTDEAIPWDEIRKNKNVVLATTEHGGHIAYFEGISGKSLWWIRVVEEYLSNLHASPSLSKQQMQKFKESASDTLQFEDSLSRDKKKSV
nr:embryogenesis-associated protein EMB8-like [Tanacetum cinerariifolium]